MFILGARVASMTMIGCEVWDVDPKLFHGKYRTLIFSGGERRRSEKVSSFRKLSTLVYAPYH